MPEETTNPTTTPEVTPAPEAAPLSDEQQVRMILEQARQEVKKIVQREREGEKIDQELLNFRMRHVNDP